MTVDREKLAAYAQGELGESERAEVEMAIATDPTLAEQLAAHQALRARLQAHFAPVLDMPVPDRLTDAVRMAAPAPTADVIDMAAFAAMLREKVQRPRRWILGGAMAASLLLGLVLGGQMQSGDRFETAEGQLIAQGDIGKALTNQASAADGRPVRILLSLRNGEGRYCRVFETEALAGLACRTEKRWVVERLQSGGVASGGQYRQAGSALGEVMAAAQAMAPDGAMNPQQERSALASGWQDRTD